MPSSAKKLLLFLNSLIIITAHTYAWAETPVPEPAVRAFYNLTYPLDNAPGGIIVLKNGKFSAITGKGTTSKFNAQLLEPVVIGSWKGTKVAALVIAYSTGGSGNFRRLYFLVNEKGKWQPRAWASLGDRIKVKYLGIEKHGILTVGMVTHAPDDPMCCPTRKIARLYMVKDRKLLPLKTAPVHLFPDQVHFKPGILQGNVRLRLVPAQGFSSHGLVKTPPYPSHIALTVNGRDVMRIFPARDYIDMWLEKNDFTIKIAINRIKRMIYKKTADFSPPLPILPPQPGLNDLAARPSVLKLQDGAGIEFIGRITKNLSCIGPDNLHYYFMGLANQDKYVISFIQKISIKQAPDSIWTCSKDINGLEKQIKDVGQYIDSLKDADFMPRISTMEKFLASIDIEDQTH